MGKNGGARPGAGRPKGSISKHTADKAAARELLRQKVIAHLGPLVDAMLASSLGLKYLVTRGPDGKFVKVTEAMAGAFKGDEIVEVWEKEPSPQMAKDLLDRALDKPQEQAQEIIVTGEVELIQKLYQGRKRAAGG